MFLLLICLIIVFFFCSGRHRQAEDGQGPQEDRRAASSWTLGRVGQGQGKVHGGECRQPRHHRADGNRLKCTNILKDEQIKWSFELQLVEFVNRVALFPIQAILSGAQSARQNDPVGMVLYDDNHSQQGAG